MTTWLLLKSGAGRAAENMAIDEALLELSAAIGNPVLRFYGWLESAATFGYSQKYADVAHWTPLRPLIRRPTGGGLVAHDRDWTYSLVFPPSHPWYALKAWDSYQRVHAWIGAAFNAIGFATSLSPREQKEEHGQCFVGAEKFDLLCDSRKIAGAAQRRNRHGLLIQGSVQPGDLSVTRDEWQTAFVYVLASGEQIRWASMVLTVPLEVDQELTSRIEQLVAEKYSQASYNQRR
jgi:lipoyl(octanoyl) transferase